KQSHRPEPIVTVTRTLHAVASGALVLIVAGCNSTRSAYSPQSSSPDVDSNSAATPGTEWFVDVAGESGLDFRHVNGMSGEYHLTEIMAPGVGLLDYDN